MKRRSAAILALGVALTIPAAAAGEANPAASCSGLASSSRAGEPTAEAQVQFLIQVEAGHEGIPPGALESDFSQNHQGSAESCLA